MTHSVLVVDDEVGMRETLTDILIGAGYQVASTGDGLSALQLMRAGHFDAVVMDIRMPEMDGVTALAEMGPPPPPVIMMTAYAMEEQLHSALDSRAYAVVHKPFGVPHLLRLVDRAIRSSASGTSR
jgi:CheY-like chemotaxis protein